MPIRAVIFDLGGVLLRTEDQTPRRELAKRLGLTLQELYHLIFDSPSARQASLGTITADEHMERVRLTLGVAPEDFSTVPGAFWSGDRLDIGLVDYIRSLRPRYKTALLSNAWSDLRGVLTERWMITDAFDEMVISAEVGIVKPDPPIYRLALERLQVAPQEAVFVDDFIENIDGGKAVGLHTIHFSSPKQAIEDLTDLLNSSI